MTEKPYHHGDLKSALIKAGIELINRDGINQLSLRKVAAYCGVSQAAPYSHFKNKEELLTAMKDYVIKQFMEVLEQSIRSCPDKDDPFVLIQMGKSYVLFFINNPLYFTFLFSQAYMEVYLSLDYDGAKNFAPYELFKKTALRVFKEDDRPKEKMEDLIISLWATVHGLAAIATMKNVHYDKAWEAKIEDIIWNR